MRSSLKWKVILQVSLILLVAFGLLAALYFHMMEDQLLEKSQRSARTLSQTLETNLRESMLARQRKEIAHIVETVGKLDVINHIEIMDPKGQVVIRSGVRPANSSAELQRALATSKPERWVDSTGVFRAVTPIRNDRSCSGASCHAASQPIIGFMDVGLSTAEPKRQIAERRDWIITTALIALLAVGFSIALILNAKVHRPILELIGTMKKVAAGDLSARSHTKATDELAFLRDDFNRMIEQIDAKNRELFSAQQQLIQAEKLASVGLLAAGLAHEINNPNATISVCAESLLETEGVPDRRRFLQAIADESARIAGTIEGLLSFGRSEVEHPVRVSIRRLLREVLGTFSIEAEKRGIETVVQLDEELPPVLGDSTELARVASNIIHNALQAMSDRGKLTITGKRVRDHVEVTFADTGGGIPTDSLDKIFDPFFTTREVGEGFGLGLAVSYEIIRRHGGEISASNSESGAVFTLKLPVA